MVLTFILAYSFINAQSGYLAFYSQTGDKFWVIVDGKKINKEPQYSVDKFPVEMKWGKVKIIFEDPKLGTIDKTYQVVDVDGNNCYVKYMIRKNEKKGKYEIRDIDATWEVINNSGATAVSQQTQHTQQTQQATHPTQTNQTTPQTQTVQQTTTVTDPTTNNNINMGVGVNVNETENGVNMHVSMPGVQTTTQTSGVTTQVTTTTTTTTTNQPVQQGQVILKPELQPVQQQQEVKPAGGCTSPMSDADFQSAKKSIASKSFEDSKLTLAKQIVSANCVLSSQVKDILGIFGFESTRLEFAKYAYKYTYDKKNYYKINDAFQFESSMDELNEFITSGND